ncbi:mlo-like protein 12 [Phtheirospermum japonicum]|uniref:Mlo-like protein 12 n=1 Tax=Phtheirospermum japonicum TaxID=374723 RepID=A0A830CZS9_9LAMI|nr:mlo-like protein 12 [Phtheirospermum japonicum]
MGMRILERGDVIKGSPVVQPGDDLFWFNRPGLILFLIHVLFENTFQLAFFAWSWYEFGYPSCYHGEPGRFDHSDFNGCPYTGPLQLCNSPSICLSHSGTILQLALNLYTRQPAEFWLNLSAPEVPDGSGVELGIYKAQLPTSNPVPQQQPHVKKRRRGPRSRSIEGSPSTGELEVGNPISGLCIQIISLSHTHCGIIWF